MLVFFFFLTSHSIFIWTKAGPWIDIVSTVYSLQLGCMSHWVSTCRHLKWKMLKMSIKCKLKRSRRGKLKLLSLWLANGHRWNVVVTLSQTTRNQDTRTQCLFHQLSWKSRRLLMSCLWRDVACGWKRSAIGSLAQRSTWN